MPPPFSQIRLCQKFQLAISAESEKRKDKLFGQISSLIAEGQKPERYHGPKHCILFFKKA